MSRKLGALLMTAAALALAAPVAQAQSIEGNPAATVIPKNTIAGPDYRAPQTAWGVVNLQGLWTNATLTTLERPKEYGDNLVMSPAEVKKIEGADAADVADAQKATDPNAKVTDLPVSCGRGFTGVNCGYNSFWVDPGKTVMRINGEPRTSFLVEPKDGHLPPLTPAASDARRAMIAQYRNGRPGMARGDNPESMTLAERCLKDFGSSSGPPMMPLLYNNTYQIVQTPGDVMIHIEMVHDARIVHLTQGSRTHPPGGHRTVDGRQRSAGMRATRWSSRRRNLRPGQGFRGAPDNSKIVRALHADQQRRRSLYSFEINDPETFTQRHCKGRDGVERDARPGLRICLPRRQLRPASTFSPATARPTASVRRPTRQIARKRKRRPSKSRAPSAQASKTPRPATVAVFSIAHQGWK